MSRPDCPSMLRVEHLNDEVLGLGERSPRLSWWLPSDSTQQYAYQIEIDGIGCEWTRSEDCVLVPWPAAPVQSRQRVAWRVRVSTDRGESQWSAPARFEMGLLDQSDWEAQWIQPAETVRGPHTLLKTMHFDTSPNFGRLYATAHGIYECFINGSRVGNLELTPGTSSYPTRTLVQVYDVGDLLSPGDNRWEVVLSDGWYRGQVGNYRGVDGYGSTLAFLGQLETDEFTVTTGPGWETVDGPLLAADLMEGQVEDHRRTVISRGAAMVMAGNVGPLDWSPAPPVRRIQELRPVSVVQLDNDKQIVDLGQNINGWLRLTELGPQGSDISLVHGEAVDANGDLTLDNLVDPTSDLAGVPFQVDRVISAGTEDEVFEPRHTTHGFQYARIEGNPKRLTPDDVSGVVVHTDLRRTGWFRCSDDRVNRFHELVDWSFRDNACDVPTDCPQRERAGWTGDWQLFVPTAALLYDVMGFSLKWLRDVAAEQLPDGCVPNVAPDPKSIQRPIDSEWRGLQGSSGWGDAVVIVPWELWRAYGDVGVLAEMWPTMVGWLDFVAEMARTERHHRRVAERPDPREYESFLWDGGFHWGEWTEPGVDAIESLGSDQGSVGTAYLHRSAMLTSHIASMLGYSEEAERYKELSINALRAWQLEYIDSDGRLAPDTQANHVRALAFGLVPTDLRDQTVARLVELIRNADTHLATGFLATPFLLPVLADSDNLDMAYELLLQDTPPSWLTMVERGATTVWESWEGIDDEGKAEASLNHYSKGAVISFLYQYVAGIQPHYDGPGYRRFRVAPRPGGGLTWAEAVLESPYGTIKSAWRAGNQFELVVTVPPGTSAEISLPGQQEPLLQGPGTQTYTQPT